MRDVMNWVALVLGLLGTTASLAGAQFEVATIRRSATSIGGEGSGFERVEVTPNSVALRNASVSFCVQWAYGVKFYQMAGRGGVNGDRWDIVAKTQAAHPEAEMRTMMRELLVERFGLTLHREMREMPVYLLTKVKEPVRVQRAGDGARSSMQVVGGSFVFRATTMAGLAERLSDFATMDRPVVDGTGLDGAFDFQLDEAARAVRGGEGPSIFTAVAELGLQLKPARAPVEMLVIDRVAAKPTEN